MKRKIIFRSGKSFLLIALVLVSLQGSMAQPSAPPTHVAHGDQPIGGGGAVPVGEGSYLLLVLGLMYGGLKIIQANRKT